MSSENTKTVVKNGFPAAGLLTTIFVLAKVFGIAPIASWSWVWVLSPLWIGWAIVIGLLLLIGLGIFLYSFVSVYLDSRKTKKKDKFGINKYPPRR